MGQRRPGTARTYEQTDYSVRRASAPPPLLAYASAILSVSEGEPVQGLGGDVPEVRYLTRARIDVGVTRSLAPKLRKQMHAHARHRATPLALSRMCWPGTSSRSRRATSRSARPERAIRHRRGGVRERPHGTAVSTIHPAALRLRWRRMPRHPPPEPSSPPRSKRPSG